MRHLTGSRLITDRGEVNALQRGYVAICTCKAVQTSFPNEGIVTRRTRFANVNEPNAEYGTLRRLPFSEAGLGGPPAAGVSTVIWATGFTGDFGWINLPAFDAEGRPIHQRGVSPVRGLYFIGFPWLNSRKSGIVYGVGEDAQYIASAIAQQLA